MKVKAQALVVSGVVSSLVFSGVVCAQGPPPGGGGDQRPGGSGRKDYTENESKPLTLKTADQDPAFESKVTITVEGDSRIIKSNSVPEHQMVGQFPNEDNPNTMAEQKVEITLPLNPTMNEKATPAIKAVGLLLNGVYVESGTGESWVGDGSGPRWNYEALGGALPFGLDENYAHVQPGGKYHYHGTPTGLMKDLEVSSDKHSPLIGWAFDGFPIYTVFGYSDPKDPDSEIVEMTSSWRLKEGKRPEPPKGPGGTYDGAFVPDYEYVAGAGTLDECNGRFTVTPEFPEGTYAYFITKQWPMIYRNFRGTPVDSMGDGHPRNGPGGPPGGGPGGGPPRGEKGHEHPHTHGPNGEDMPPSE